MDGVFAIEKLLEVEPHIGPDPFDHYKIKGVRPAHQMLKLCAGLYKNKSG